MREFPDGWLTDGPPFTAPKTCRWCKTKLAISRGKNAVLVCKTCDQTERWPKRG